MQAFEDPQSKNLFGRKSFILKCFVRMCQCKGIGYNTVCELAVSMHRELSASFGELVKTAIVEV